MTKTLKKEIRKLMFRINPLRIDYSIGMLFKNIDMYSILHKFKVSQKFIEYFIEHDEYIGGPEWNAISCRQDVSESFIRKHRERMDWMYICIHQKLSESFMREMKDYVLWNYAAENQKMSSDFILEFSDCINYYCLTKNRHKDMQVLPDTLIYELSVRINPSIFKKAFLENKKITTERLIEIHHKYDWNDRFDILDL